MGIKTKKTDQAILVANLISRVTSLEDDMNFAFKHIRILEDDVLKKYKLPDDRMVIFRFDENGVGKISIEAMDVLMEMLGAKEIDDSKGE